MRHLQNFYIYNFSIHKFIATLFKYLELTKLGIYLSRKPLSQAKLARMTGISKDRISRLHIDLRTKPTIEEIYLISLALNVSIQDITNFICSDLALRPESEWK